MTDSQIALLALGVVGFIGIALIVSGVLAKVLIARKNSSCTASTTGVVVRHGFNGEKRMYPVVMYAVDGVSYHVRKKYNGVKFVQVSGLPVVFIHPEAYEDDKGWLHVKYGPVANLRALAEDLWPRGSSMVVYYDPADPKTSYVDRPVSATFACTFLVLMGISTLALGVLVFFLIQL